VMLSKQLAKPIAERMVDCDSLRRVIERQERELVQRSTAFGDFTRNLRLTWRDVQEGLQQDEMAVEFLSFPVAEGETRYIALTLHKNDTMPRMVTMFDEKALKAVDAQHFSASSEMTEVVWGPLREEMKGVKNVYFAPSGELHRLGIEYLPGMEEYNLYRVSSTREIVNRAHAVGSGAVLYGDIDYDATIEQMMAHAKQQPQTTNTSEMYAYNSTTALRGMDLLRAGGTPLQYTRREVDSIHQLLPQSTVYLALDATEESFKALAGQRRAIIHLATHGFYYTPTQVEQHDQLKFLSLGDNHSAEDKALSRSGLLMAGANNQYNGNEYPDGLEDGVLTAREIALVDLRGCDLAVLSACETAQGDISSAEGVFGLQRGFKKAGVKSLLMSLWQVDDQATQILMTEFYRHLVAGSSKRAALAAAQHHLRHLDAGKWDHPQYWSSFILLDSLE